MKIPFKAADILLPKNADMSKWSVVACDQYTSEMEYWKDVEKIVNSNSSTLNLTLPEIYLNESNVQERINRINKNMKELINSDFFKEYKDSMIYLERTQSDGKVREGLMGAIDLEDYSYEAGSSSLIRATEKTVIERIPPRVKVRKNALLELPHIMILIDDDKCDIIENLKNEVTNNDVVYDFDLMKNGGHIKGYILNQNSINNINSKLEKLADQSYFEKKYNVTNKGVLLFAMGDGNHSLATAKTCYENLKKEIGEEKAKNSKARYALVEIVNLHSKALEFEAINRVLFNVNTDKLLKQLTKYYELSDNEGQKFLLVTKDETKVMFIKNPKSNIAVGSLQMFLDDYLKNNEGTIDYIHGEDVVTKLVKENDNSLGFMFDAMPKEELFRTVILDGALPRKTFSMGHSYDKRYYLEARRIK